MFACNHVCLLVTLQESGCSYRDETFRIDGQWLRNNAIKFTRWQHPAVGMLGGDVVPGTSSVMVSVWCVFAHCIACIMIIVIVVCTLPITLKFIVFYNSRLLKNKTKKMTF